MLHMYRSVAKIEKNMRNYGVSALRLNARRSGGTTNHSQNAANNSTQSANDQGIMCRIKRLLVYMIPSLRCDEYPASRSNRATSQKRVILLMATGYALAWFIVYTPLVILSSGVDDAAIWILVSCLIPLQGLFNFLVFMSPKVRSAKRSKRGEENLTWNQAFIKAYMSRGERRRRTVRNTTRSGGIS